MRAHGLRSTYNFGVSGKDPAEGCRCDACRKANTEYQRIVKARRRAEGRVTRKPRAWAEPDGSLRVECWCRATTVLVPVAEVRAVLTRSCGTAQCDALDLEAQRRTA